MTQDRRKRLIELSREYNFIIVEDDPYGRLRYEGGHQIPLKAQDEHVLYLGTISKISRRVCAWAGWSRPLP